MASINSNYLTEGKYVEPTGREEAWRFTPVKELEDLLRANNALQAVNSYIINSLELKLTVSDITTASVPGDTSTLKLIKDVHTGQILEIPRNYESTENIVLKRVNLGAEPAGSRLQVIVGENAHAKIVIENQGPANLLEDLEFLLQQGSSLELISIQEWSSDAIHLARQHAILAKDSHFKSVLVTTGGKIVRILPTVEFTGPGAYAELDGLYFASSGQHLEHRLHVDHNVANAKSRVKYKGALSAASARTVWIGDVYIRANAEGTDTYELNRNLLLSDGARADSVPNLEIETGEIVGAGHASTSGRFDEEQLFYLMSKGINEVEARRLVIRGFFAEILREIKDQDLEERLMENIDKELSKVGN